MSDYGSGFPWFWIIIGILFWNIIFSDDDKDKEPLDPVEIVEEFQAGDTVVVTRPAWVYDSEPDDDDPPGPWDIEDREVGEK